MALNNMKNEPRREWTEQGVGFLLMAVFCVYVYFAGRWVGEGLLPRDVSGDFRAQAYIFGGLISTVAPFLAYLGFWGVANLMHAIGEGVCDSLAKRGIDPRPLRWNLKKRVKNQTYSFTDTVRRVEGTPEQIKRKWGHLMQDTKEYTYYLEPLDRREEQPYRVNMDEVAT